jgi:hypothetical protein
VTVADKPLIGGVLIMDKILIPVEYCFNLANIDREYSFLDDVRSDETIREILDSCNVHFDETYSLMINGEYISEENFSDCIIKYFDGENKVRMEVAYHADDFENEGKA